jgi:dTDP-4-amino-4,6-dideoxygalactose transaminase
MNILFMHEVDWLKKAVFDIHNLAEIFSIRGHEVYAIDYQDTWKKSGFWDLGSSKTEEAESKARAIPGSLVTLRRPGFIKVPVLSRLSAGLHEVYKPLGHKEGSFPETERACKEVLSLPIYPEMEEGHIKFIAEKVKQFCKK